MRREGREGRELRLLQTVEGRDQARRIPKVEVHTLPVRSSQEIPRRRLAAHAGERQALTGEEMS